MMRRESLRRSESNGAVPLVTKSDDPAANKKCFLWTLNDALQTTRSVPNNMTMPLTSFNHVAREVLNLEESMKFYCDILGFKEVRRPPFKCPGF